MFSEEIAKLSWEEITRSIYAKTEADVRRALNKEHCTVDDFMALISPAATPYLEEMAMLSKRYTEERFGRTMSFRAYHVAFHSIVPYQFLCKLVRVLWLSHQQSHASYHLDFRGNGKRIQSHQGIRPL